MFGGSRKRTIEPAVDSPLMRPEAGRHPSYPVVKRSWDAVFKPLRHQSPAARAFDSCGLSFMASLWKTL